MERNSRSIALLTYLYEAEGVEFSPDELTTAGRYRREQDMKGQLTQLDKRGLIEKAYYLKTPEDNPEALQIFVTRKGEQVVKRYKPTAKRRDTL